MKCMYKLTKMSSPGFELETSHISVIKKMLQNEICSMCTLEKEGQEEIDGLTINKEYYNELINNSNKLFEQHKGYRTITKENSEKLKIIDSAIVYELLSTSCGAEYWFEEHKEDENGEDYMKQLNEDLEEYDNLVKE